MNAPVSNSARKLNGGQALAEMLKLSGVGPMFGMGGFQLLPFYEAMRALGLRHFLINDERCGAFASDAYARVTNRPGVCDATLGPGATNLVTALVESLNAGIPQIAIIGDANRDHAWKNMTQEARQVEILKPAVKELIRVEGTKRIPELVRRAFAVATSGRPGPVVLDVPEDVCHGEHDFDAADFWVDDATLKAQARRTRPDPHELERAAAIIAKAERPLLLVGGGIHISEAYDALLALAEGFGIPVAHTMSGKGAIACTHPLSAGLFGRYSRIANDLVAASDALIVVACKLGEIPTRRFQLIPPGKPLIHIDILAEEIGRTTRTDVALVADARLALQDLAAALSDGGTARAKRQPWCAEVPSRMGKWHEGAADRLKSSETPINVGRLMGELNAHHAGRCDPRGGRRLRRPLGRAAVRHQARRTAFHRRPRLRVDRLRPARLDGRAACRAEAPRRRADRRRRLQHDARRTGNRAPLPARRSCCACSTMRPPAT